ncbi:MAG: hypothetical protein HY473_02640 [Candidatus Sungbacteria bacterium]|uniref:Dockerin domain-containing protein n=1 Tax=Candidatus Sungiibacteriota bacterium TaxID=2750080 RepID=A0A933DTJ5_9BACT|nr:hypothetical protein [Candidatus Sungbacteria bacterium]
MKSFRSVVLGCGPLTSQKFRHRSFVRFFASPQWFTNNQTADINRDGVVNSIDFSWLNRNWGRSGE